MARGLVCVLMLTTLCGPCVLAQGSNVLETTLYDETPANTFVYEVADNAGLSNSYTEEELSNAVFNILSSASEWSYLFRIDSNNGDVRTAELVDRDMICPGQEECIINLDVTFQLGDDLQIIKISLLIIDTNDNSPSFPQPQVSKSLPENSALGYSFRIPTAEDIDSPTNGIVHYELVSGGPEFELKVTTLSENTFDLHLVVQQELDRENQDSYVATVAATDGGIPPNSGVLNVDITIVDVNDNNPVFEEDIYTVTLPEDTPIGTAVVQIHAVDLDSGINGQIIYGFETATDGLFVIDNSTGQITLGANLDYEQSTEFSLVVTARDMNPEALTAEARVVVHVTNVNDHPPAIVVDPLSSSGLVEVSEGASIGAFVALVRVEDPDSPEATNITCQLTSSVFTLQQIYGETEYKITTAAVLDRESIPVHDIVFSCNDGGSPLQSSSVHIEVNILDQNDNVPLFEKQTYSVVVEENNPIGAPLAQVHAVDFDTGSNGRITYHLAPEAVDYINIDPDFGNITARIQFDYESNPRLEFSIIAADGGEDQQTATATLLILLTDLDDNLPVFVMDPYEFDVYEHQSIGTSVGQISASDRDSAPYDEVEYHFQQDSDVFHLDANYGHLFTRQSLDREQLSEYRLVALAVARNTPGMTSTCEIIIYVADKNDNAPFVTFPNVQNNTVYIENNHGLNASVVQIQALDADIGINGQLSFDIIAGNELSYFRLDRTSGILFVNGDLHVFDAHIFQLTLSVHDNGYPAHTVEVTLNIVVNKSADQAVISSQNFTIVISVVSVTALLTVILVVAIVIVRRQDSRGQPKVSYSNQVLYPSSPKAEDSQVDGSNRKTTAFSNHGYLNQVVTNDLEPKSVFSVPKTASTSSLQNESKYAYPFRAPLRTPSLDCHSLACDNAPGKSKKPRGSSSFTASGTGTNHHLHYMERSQPLQPSAPVPHGEVDRDSTNSVTLSTADSGRGSNEENESSESNNLNQSRDEVVLRLPRPNMAHNRNDAQQNLDRRKERSNMNNLPPKPPNYPNRNIHKPPPALPEKPKELHSMNQLKFMPRTHNPVNSSQPMPNQRLPGPSSGPSRGHPGNQPGSHVYGSRGNHDRSWAEEESETEWSDEDKEYVYYVNASQV